MTLRGLTALLFFGLSWQVHCIISSLDCLLSSHDLSSKMRYVEDELTHKHRDYQSATMPPPTCPRTSLHIPQMPDRA